MSRHARRVDRNQPEIVATLRACGWYWKDTSKLGDGFPDGLVAKHGRVWFVEIKDGAKVQSKQQLTPAQVREHAAFKASGVPVVILRSVDDALALR